MASTTVGLASGKEIQVDESIDEVKDAISRAGRNWVELTTRSMRVEVVGESVVYLQEILPGGSTAGPEDERSAIPIE